MDKARYVPRGERIRQPDKLFLRFDDAPLTGSYLNGHLLSWRDIELSQRVDKIEQQLDAIIGCFETLLTKLERRR